MRATTKGQRGQVVAIVGLRVCVLSHLSCYLWLFYFLAVCLWTSNLTSLNFKFFIYQVEIAPPENVFED